MMVEVRIGELIITSTSPGRSMCGAGCSTRCSTPQFLAASSCWAGLARKSSIAVQWAGLVPCDDVPKRLLLGLHQYTFAHDRSSETQAAAYMHPYFTLALAISPLGE